MLIPLAGPANKQGRLAADNMAFGNTQAYRGTLGASVLKVFGMTAAAVGANERVLKAAGIAFQSVTVHPENHAGYYPGATLLTVKVLFSAPEGKILGAQAVGEAGTEKRIDVISALMGKGGTVSDMARFEQAYAPPYSSAKDPVNMAGFAAENILTGKVRVITWDSLRDAPAGEYLILDVRTPEEFARGAIGDARNIPIDELRERLGEIPRGKKIVAYCRVGMRSYLANRILLHNGFDAWNLSGGYYTWINAVS
jgi:rhodanese-related sulfurtransferase